jgi:hypothetical protein
MRTTNLITKPSSKRSIVSIAVLVVFSAFTGSSSFAQQSKPKTFSSPQEASSALFRALQNEDEQALESILGGGKEVTSSGDEVEDQLEREKFRKKYQEMHRLVREPDGTTVLYIGAENWPFPIPLVSKGGRWLFDSDAGMQEIQFRRVGENETTAIQVCGDFARAKKQPDTDAPSGDAIRQYALSLVNTGADTHSTTRAEPAKEPSSFHDYYFRTVPVTPFGKNADAVALVAYPVEYRSTGVITLIVTQNGGVYEKDLGPNTEKIAKTITVRKPGSKWREVQSAEVPTGKDADMRMQIHNQYNSKPIDEYTTTWLLPPNF